MSSSDQTILCVTVEKRDSVLERGGEGVPRRRSVLRSEIEVYEMNEFSHEDEILSHVRQAG